MIKDKIKEIRLNARLSQLEFSNKLNCCRHTVTSWESGSKIPDTVNIIKICNIFKVSADYVLGIGKFTDY